MATVFGRVWVSLGVNYEIEFDGVGIGVGAGEGVVVTKRTMRE